MKNTKQKNPDSEKKELRIVAIAAAMTVVLILTIVLVAFFSGKIDKIEIINSNVKIDENGEKYAVVYLDENRRADYQIEYDLTPKNVKAKKVEFHYNKSTPGVSVNEDGLVSFTEVTAVEVAVRLKNSDDSSVEDKIFLIAKYKE